MIALAITAALIIQTYDHQTRVVENLSDAGCDAARCLAQYSKSCIAQAADGVRAHKWEEERLAYLKAHPPKPISCGKGCTMLSVDILNGGNSVIFISATETAMCVK